MTRRRGFWRSAYVLAIRLIGIFCTRRARWWLRRGSRKAARWGLRGRDIARHADRVEGIAPA